MQEQAETAFFFLVPTGGSCGNSAMVYASFSAPDQLRLSSQHNAGWQAAMHHLVHTCRLDRMQ